MYVTGRKRSTQSRRLVVAAVLVGSAWLATNLLSAYAAANPWATAVLWRPPDHEGALAAAVTGRDITDDDVIGRFIEPIPGKATVVVVHGYGDDRDAPPVVAVAGWLHEAGYGVLVVDLGYLHDRHRYSGGHREANDITSAVDWLEQRGQPIAAVWGFSAGAHAALIAATRDPRIPAVVADSPFADGEAQIRRIASATWKLPPSSFFLVGPAMKLFSGDQPVNVAALDWPGTTRALIIAGEDDTTVPAPDARNITGQTAGELLQLPGVGHTQAYRDAPSAYRDRALDFVGRAVPRPSA